MMETQSTSMEEVPDGKSDKQKAPKKVPSNAIAWVCEIEGCNKKFAREADLRRHQRTAKVHVVPESKSIHPCPQCNASFTRTDALKRHQKSRHNGVIIIPSSGKRDSGESQRNADAAGPSSRSRVGSPSTEEGTDATSDIATLAASPAVIPPHPEALGPGSGPQSYYRQHTHDTIFIHSPNSVREPTDSEPNHRSGLAALASPRPSSAYSRNWPPAPPWIQESPGTALNTSGTHYRPGSYYRTPDGQPAPPNPVQVVAPNSPLLEQLEGVAHCHYSSTPTKGLPAENGMGGETVPEPLSNLSSDTTMLDNSQPSFQRIPSPMPATDRIGMNAAVQRALQAMLAIDPSLGNMPSSMEQPDDLSSPVSFQVPLSAFAALANNIYTTHSDDVAFSTDATSSIETDDGTEASCEERSMEEVVLGESVSENGTPMLRPEEILNEDSFMYAPPD